MGKRTTKNQRTKDNTIDKTGISTPRSAFSPLRRKQISPIKSNYQLRKKRGQNSLNEKDLFNRTLIIQKNKKKRVTQKKNKKNNKNKEKVINKKTDKKLMNDKKNNSTSNIKDNLIKELQPEGFYEMLKNLFNENNEKIVDKLLKIYNFLIEKDKYQKEVNLNILNLLNKIKNLLEERLDLKIKKEII